MGTRGFLDLEERTPARYDWTHVPEQAQHLAMETDLPESVTGGDGVLRRAMRKGLHAAKKADGRVRRLKNDINQRNERDLKMQHLEEQKRFEADVKALEAEVQATTTRTRHGQG